MGIFKTSSLLPLQLLGFKIDPFPSNYTWTSSAQYITNSVLYYSNELGCLRLGKGCIVSVFVMMSFLAAIVIMRLVWGFARTMWGGLAEERVLRKQGVPVVPGRNLIMGHALVLRDMAIASLSEPQDPHDPHNICPRLFTFFHRNTKAYGKTHLFWLGPQATLHTADPEFVRSILVTKFKQFEKDEVQVKVLEKFVGKYGLATVAGDSWAQQRKLVNPAFHHDKLATLVPVMVRSIDAFIVNWTKIVDETSGSAEIEVSLPLGNISADIISRTSFGSTYEKGKIVFAYQSEVASILANNIMKPKLPGQHLLPTTENRRLWTLRRSIKQNLGEILLQARKKNVGQQSSDYGTDLLGLMMSACENKKQLSNEELMDEICTFLLGAKDTTATTMTWTLLLLAIHEDWQEKAYQEIQAVCGENSPTYDKLSKLKIVGNILNETMRLYPPAAFLQRQASTDVTIGELLIPKGLNILMNTLAMHVDPEQWGPDALEFRPDRFANGVSKACKHPHAFAPFSVGPRSCVGQNFSILEVKVLVVAVLQRFRLTPSPNYRHEPTWKVIVKPAHDVPVIFSKRSP